MEQHQPNNSNCPADQISAYIDGELSADREMALERHIAACGTCRSELNEQKSFLLGISDTLDRELDFDLPADFTKRIVVNAESNVSGLRDREERGYALAAAAVLFVLIVVVLGGNAGSAFTPVRAVFDKAYAVAGVGGQIVFDLVYAVSAILRTVFSTQTFTSLLAYTVLSLAAIGVVLIVMRWLRFKRDLRASGSK